MNRRNFMTAAASMWAAGGLAGVSRIASAAPAVVRFGQSASLSGAQAGYGRDVRDGILAAFAAASAQPDSPRFELVTLDDGGERGHCVQNVNSLIDGGVTALIGLTSGSGAEACMPAVEKAQLALLGTASGNMGIRAAKASSVYHVRAGYDLEYRRMTAYLKDFGLRRVGVVNLDDASKANLDALKAALHEAGIEPKTVVALDHTASNFDGVADQLLAAQLDCVLFTTHAAPIAAITERMNAARYPGLYYASSFAGQDLLNTLASRQDSCVMSVVVPRPNAVNVNIVSCCQQDLAAHAPKARMAMTTLEGYITGRTAVEAAHAALKNGGVSRGRLRESIAGLRSDLGGYKIDFAAGSTQGSHFVDLITLDRYGRMVG